jgi:multiple sugar transport system substrate-binding protein/sn-glycerol 3-phosphate transport system substrate-binding protein
MSSSVGIPYQVAAFEDAGTTDEWIFIPFVGPNGEKAVDSFGQYVAVVNTTPAQNVATWLFLKFFTSPEVQATWINASAYYSVRMSTNALLEDYGAAHPQWLTGLDLVQYGMAEPTFASYGAVRREVGDTFDMILQGTPDDIMTYLEELNTTAAELVAEIDS